MRSQGQKVLGAEEAEPWYLTMGSVHVLKVQVMQDRKVQRWMLVVRLGRERSLVWVGHFLNRRRRRRQ